MPSVSFNTDADLRLRLDEFFESKQSDFYQRVTENLFERWEEVANNKREYIIDQLLFLLKL